MQSYNLKKFFNNESKKNIGFVDEATQGFDADFGKIIKKTQKAVKRTLGMDAEDYRQKQFANYMNTIQRLKNNKVRLSGKYALGTDTRSTTGRITTVGRNVPNTAVSLQKVLDEYRTRALRLAQAKYYQRQLG
tara:strand:- start:143 stop:541 length:399 start_codon:yes stop_codon:yes gene_type:complete